MLTGKHGSLLLRDAHQRKLLSNIASISTFLVVVKLHDGVLIPNLDAEAQ
ncbi:hypothetical protein L195_g053537 [Trifolium pratense]|uniref:Uncharacterized protein n=1 Tax=Trifolium pratense TaxID=57577 RepID=A0A2K3KB27_TRIPR|nr:hypothetical protein L195_g053537 [Trifolium pratense]